MLLPLAVPFTCNRATDHPLGLEKAVKNQTR
jgi:hypothetical protein